MGKYTHIKQYEAGMQAMKERGCTRAEIAARYGLTKEQVKEFFKRKRQKQREQAGIRGRKAEAMKTNQELRSELKHLRMEVEVLRNFAAAMGRK